MHKCPALCVEFEISKTKDGLVHETLWGERSVSFYFRRLPVHLHLGFERLGFFGKIARLFKFQVEIIISFLIAGARFATINTFAKRSLFGKECHESSSSTRAGGTIWERH
jgi:hypothetical protein